MPRAESALSRRSSRLTILFVVQARHSEFFAAPSHRKPTESRAHDDAEQLTFATGVSTTTSLATSDTPVITNMLFSSRIISPPHPNSIIKGLFSNHSRSMSLNSFNYETSCSHPYSQLFCRARSHEQYLHCIKDGESAIFFKRVCTPSQLCFLTISSSISDAFNQQILWPCSLIP